MRAHQDAVSRISAQVSAFHKTSTPFRLYHGSTNSTQSRKVDARRMVDTSSLNHVLSVNKEAKTCLVEPNVPMDQLVDATLPYGLVPPVIMEFPGITAGGGFAGTAGESSGFRYGFFEDTVNSIEMVAATGEVLSVSAQEHPDLFYGASGKTARPLQYLLQYVDRRGQACRHLRNSGSYDSARDASHRCETIRRAYISSNHQH